MRYHTSPLRVHSSRRNVLVSLLVVVVFLATISRQISEAFCTIEDRIANTPQCPNTCEACAEHGYNVDSPHCATCHCLLTQRPPQRTIVGLTACPMHSARSCCIPVFDNDILDYYETLNDVGERCAQELREAKSYLREIFCLACDPDQPKYLVNGAVQICKSFAEKIAPTHFDECGLLKVTERGMPALGDDAVFPSIEWDGYESFLNDQCGAKPPFFGDYGITIVDDSVANHGPCFGEISSGVAAASVRALPLVLAVVLFVETFRRSLE